MYFPFVTMCCFNDYFCVPERKNFERAEGIVVWENQEEGREPFTEKADKVTQ